MTTQPEALRLADDCDEHMVDFADVAAELRRLHEAHEWQYTMAGQRLRRIEKLEASNTELLAALQLAYNTLAELSFTDDKINATRVKARAAINKAERTTT